MRPHVSMLLLVGCIVLSMPDFPSAQTSSLDDQVRIKDVSVVMSNMGPVIFLKAHKRVVQIFVDPTVAGSIDGALRGMKSPRPLSHDLMHTILREFGGTVTEVRIKLKGHIYYGELVVAVNGDHKVFDSRSSDAIALAIHFEAPIFVAKELFDQADSEKNNANDAQLL